MLSLTPVWNFLWAHRRYWMGPIIVMMAVTGILFAISFVARIFPYFSAMF